MMTSEVAQNVRRATITTSVRPAARNVGIVGAHTAMTVGLVEMAITRPAGTGADRPQDEMDTTTALATAIARYLLSGRDRLRGSGLAEVCATGPKASLMADQSIDRAASNGGTSHRPTE